MVWFKVDDKLHEHRKPRQAGLAAMGLWVLAGSWAADNVEQYDGFVPAHVVARFTSSYRSMASKLVSAGLWIPGELDGETGWWFHDWKSCNPTAADVIAKRNADAERKRRGRERQKSHPESERTSNGTDAVTPTVTGDVTPDDRHAPVPVRVTTVPTRPDPTRPVELTLGGQRPETLHAVTATQPPDQPTTAAPDGARCTRHPNGNPTDEPCAGCARIREARDQAEAAAAAAAEREARHRIQNCPDCHGTGWTEDRDDQPTRICRHPHTRKTA